MIHLTPCQRFALARTIKILELVEQGVDLVDLPSAAGTTRDIAESTVHRFLGPRAFTRASKYTPNLQAQIRNLLSSGHSYTRVAALISSSGTPMTKNSVSAFIRDHGRV